MNGIFLINKPKDYTSRDVVNIIGKKFKTKKVGHTGTLDPIATGVLVICVGKYTKLVDLITSYDKEYIAHVILGIETDTLDITGNVIKKVETNNITKDDIINALNHFKGKYNQEVPIYSAVKINGKKLYEYARDNISVELPKREVEIKNIEILDDIMVVDSKIEFKFKVLVSKGTYIRSLIRDIGSYLGSCATMKELIRTKQGNFNIEECNNIDDNNFKCMNIKEILPFKTILIDEELSKKICNGVPIENTFNENIVMFEYKGEILAIYKIYDNNKTILKPYKML